MSIWREKVLTSSDLFLVISLPDNTLTDVDTITFDVKDSAATSILSGTATNISTGNYYAAGTIPASAALGTATIEWTYKLTASSTPQLKTNSFDLLDATDNSQVDPNVFQELLYVSVADMLSEIVLIEDQPSDPTVVLTEKITFTQQYIERITHQFFNQRQLVVDLDGDGTTILGMPFPIVNVTNIEFRTGLTDYTEQTLDNFAIYNRYEPDDREYPKIGIIGSLTRNYDFAPGSTVSIFPYGPKSVRVTGTFGYVEQDGTTPYPIRKIVKMMVMTFLKDICTSKGNLRMGKVFEEDRGNQLQVEIHEEMSHGAYTGDPEIDDILKFYTKVNDVRQS